MPKIEKEGVATGLKVREKVKALVYKIRIFEGIMDQIHGGGGYWITEMFIPSSNIVVNLVGDGHVFVNNKRIRHNQATDVREIEIPEVLASRLERHILLREELLRLAKPYLKEGE